MLGSLTSVEIEQLLSDGLYGRLACTDGEDVYLVPISYLYHDGFIIAHSREGKKISMMRQHQAVCFEVDAIKEMCNWQTVIVNGTYEEITDEAERCRAMQLMVEHLMKLKISETARPPHLEANRMHPVREDGTPVVVFRIRIQEKSGRFEKTDKSHTGL